MTKSCSARLTFSSCSDAVYLLAGIDIDRRKSRLKLLSVSALSLSLEETVCLSWSVRSNTLMASTMIVWAGNGARADAYWSVMWWMSDQVSTFYRARIALWNRRTVSRMRILFLLWLSTSSVCAHLAITTKTELSSLLQVVAIKSCSLIFCKLTSLIQTLLHSAQYTTVAFWYFILSNHYICACKIRKTTPRFG